MGEKKLDAAAEELRAFTEPPVLDPAEQLEADSYVDSAAEQLDALKAAGYKVPEKAPGAKLDLPDAIGGIEQGFNTEANLAPEAQIEADSYTESFAEQLDELRSDGIKVPEEKPRLKLDLPDAVGGIEQGFNTEANLTPEAQLEADSYTQSAAELSEEVKKILEK